MRMWLWIISMAGLLVFPLEAGAADERPSSPETGDSPPVAQVLVREGDFAIKLAETLGLGTTTAEAQAEDLLTNAGVTPLNGWLSDYPVTPQIIGQLEEAISRSASEGKLLISSDSAVKGLHAVAAQFDLPTPVQQGQASAKGSPPPATESRHDQEVINTYYYDNGPPIITYYPPPYGYVYLYDWVPYPVWWYGYWFPGFYICHDFTTVVVHHNHHSMVSNHFRDIHTGRAGWVDPRGPGAHGGRVQSELRTAGGARYRTLGDLRNGVRLAGPAGERQRRSGEQTTFAGKERRWDPGAGRNDRALYDRYMRVPPPNGSAPRGDPRVASRDGSRNPSGHAAVRPPARQYPARVENRYVPSQRYVVSPGLREGHGQWGGHVAGSAGSFSNSHSSNVQRGSGRSVSGYGGVRSRF